MVILRIQYTAHVFLLGFVTLLPHNDSAEKLAKGDMQTNMGHLQETKFAPVAWNDEQKNKSKTFQTRGKNGNRNLNFTFL